MELHIQNLIDDDRCYEAVRRLRWGSEIKCAHCEDKHIIKRGRDDKEHRADSIGRRNTFNQGGVYGTTSGMDV